MRLERLCQRYGWTACISGRLENTDVKSLSQQNFCLGHVKCATLFQLGKAVGIRFGKAPQVNQ